jgi:putative NADPH-quinone reductase
LTNAYRFAIFDAFREAWNLITVLLLAHPDFAASRANRALLAGLNDLPGLEVAELYALYPDGKIDVAVERERVLRADRLVLEFPLQWYSTPPLLKYWQDAVLTPLFYLEPSLAASTAGLPVLAATTTGGPSASYQPGGAGGMTIDELFAPLRATARKCSWLWQAPFALHDVRNLDDAAMARASEDYRSVILSAPMLEQRSEVVA